MIVCLGQGCMSDAGAVHGKVHALLMDDDAFDCLQAMQGQKSLAGLFQFHDAWSHASLAATSANEPGVTCRPALPLLVQTDCAH